MPQFTDDAPIIKPPPVRAITHSSRRTLLIAAAMVAVALTGCAIPFPSIQFAPEETSTPTGQTNAPYPADLNHLDDILTLAKTTLPEGATDITVTLAVKFAESYPGGWGYVIAYHADPQPIRNHIDTYTDLKGENLESYPDSTTFLYIKDIDFSDIHHPVITGFGKVQLVVERPLGRCWMLIRGAPR